MKHRIKFSDGRSGTQQSHTDEDGKVVLDEIVITHGSDGRHCEQGVYGPRRWAQDDVWSFADLGNVTWEIVEPLASVVPTSSPQG